LSIASCLKTALTGFQNLSGLFILNIIALLFTLFWRTIRAQADCGQEKNLSIDIFATSTTIDIIGNKTLDK
jgi:hypothetical protein